jgi:hypothetical protein
MVRDKFVRGSSVTMFLYLGIVLIIMPKFKRLGWVEYPPFERIITQLMLFKPDNYESHRTIENYLFR